MIICPHCQHEELPGSVFCTECGAQLLGAELITQKIAYDGLATASRVGGTAPPPIPEYQATEAWISLHLLNSGHILPLSDANEFTLGRVSEGQPIMPDVDLSPFQAYANGVSRLHAVVKRSGNQVLVMDLGSANGSYVNGRRLDPNHEHKLVHGDVLALGKLKIQILLKNE